MENLKIKNIALLLQQLLFLTFIATANANLPCQELIPHLKTNDSKILNEGLWEHFEKDPSLQNQSTQALQLDSRINKIFFILDYLCKTQNGIPLNDLALYLSYNISNKGEAAFKEELISLGKTSQQIKNWFEFFRFAQNHKSRILDRSSLQITINGFKTLINEYKSLTKGINQQKSSDFFLKKTKSLTVQIDNFLSSDPYTTQALGEISRVPYWDINESIGGS